MGLWLGKDFTFFTKIVSAAIVEMYNDTSSRVAVNGQFAKLFYITQVIGIHTFGTAWCSSSSSSICWSQTTLYAYRPYSINQSMKIVNRQVSDCN